MKNRKIYYNKLVRDHIPEIIEAAGKQYAVEVMERDAYRSALLQKLVEEAQEVLKAPDHKLIIEMADLFEVIDWILASYKISKDDVVAIQNARRDDRGGFQKRLRLLWSESD